MKRVLLFVMLTAVFLLDAGITIPVTGLQLSHAAETGWKAEFDAVCGQTDNAMNMGVEELKKALERCDRLKVQLEQLEPTPRKVYLKRLQMCRNLFDYMLESKQKELPK